MEMLVVVLIALVLGATLVTLKFAPWLPARGRDISRVLKLADLQPKEKFYDLGCGDGRLVRAAARKGADAVGIELSPPLYIWCRLHGFLKPLPGARFRLRNFFRINLTDSDVVYLFGTQDTVGGDLKAKLEQELRAGTRVISYVFPISGWEPVSVDKPEGELAIYLYRR